MTPSPLQCWLSYADGRPNRRLEPVLPGDAVKQLLETWTVETDATHLHIHLPNLRKSVRFNRKTVH